LKTSLIDLLETLLRKNKIRVNEEELEFQLLSHPSYPGLHAITGVLDHFYIENSALEVPKSIETLDLLPESFLAIIKDKEYNGFVFVDKQNDGFQLFDTEGKKRTLTFENFLEIWSGVIVAVEQDSQEVNPAKKINFANIVLVLTGITFLFLFFFYDPDLFRSIHFLLSLVGVFVCVLILQHELGLHSKVLDKFCSEENKKTNCNAVLNSKGATIFGSFKFSDVGIIYFVSLTLSWFLSIIGHVAHNSIILITISAVPFTFYSIYYQFKVVRQWCLLCLSIVSVLWLQAGSLYFAEVKNLDISFNLDSILLTSFSFLVIFTLWQFISPKLKKEQELKALKIEHYKFKRNYTVFKSLISRTAEIYADIEDKNEIVFGNKNDDSLLKIIIITNPLCRFCKETHELAENILKRNENNIRITIRFYVSGDSDSFDTKSALKLTEIYNTAGEDVCLNAMRDIYGKLSQKEWLEKWGETKDKKYTETILNEKKWCSQNNINFTPEVLINGRSFPKEYNRADLLYFIDELIEEKTEKINSES
jgi:uncharacterized membrane protein